VANVAKQQVQQQNAIKEHSDL